MPLVRYFLYMGGALLALLFVANAALPQLPVEQATNATGAAKAEIATIRIRSDRKWPERIVFDTSVPAAAAATALAAKAEPVRTVVAEAAAPAQTSADFSAKARVRETFAQFPTPGEEVAPASESRKAEVKPQPKRKIAKRHVAPPMMLVAQQPQFGFAANRIW